MPTSVSCILVEVKLFCNKKYNFKLMSSDFNLYLIEIPLLGPHMSQPASFEKK